MGRSSGVTGPRVRETEIAPTSVATRVASRLEHARLLSDRLFSQVRPEAWLDRPIPERHRVLFYLGHLEAFDWNQITQSVAADGPADPCDQLFAFGIDPPPGELPSDQPGDWPSLEETREYVRSTRRRLSDVIDRVPDGEIDTIVEHRLMHVETLTYLLHAMPYERRVVRPGTAPGGGPIADGRRVEIPAGLVTLGKTRGTGFGWDNEFESHSQPVEGFAVDRYKVTNGQYFVFVEEGGEPPPFWTRHGGAKWRGFDAQTALPLDHPVYVTWEQAAAFARWAGGRLPTEAQFHRYAFGTPEGEEREYPWGSAAPTRAHGNFNFAARDTVPVTATPAGDSAFGVAQAVGNGWEWTRTPFAPFPGFAATPSYPGYSAPFFDGLHYVVKGASCVTERTLLRRSFRNWFRPHYRHAYTTFRVVET